MADPSPVDLDDVVRLRRDLLDDGFTDQQIRALVRSGVLHRVRQGAYVRGDLWRDLSDVDRHRVKVRAVLKRAHPSTVATHVSAAVEHGAPIWNVRLDEVHVTRRDGKPGRREAGVVHHRGHLPDDHVEEVNGIPVSIAARCAVEVATITAVEPALVVVNGLLHAEKMTPAEFAEMVEMCKHWPDSLSLHVVARLADGRIASVGETRTDFLCWAQHLPRPTPQVEILDESGRAWARVDFAWPQHGVFLEFDGVAKYERHRLPGETLDEFLMREKAREERICALTGWVCIRITWQQLATPQATAARIRRLLASRTVSA